MIGEKSLQHGMDSVQQQHTQNKYHKPKILVDLYKYIITFICTYTYKLSQHETNYLFSTSQLKEINRDMYIGFNVFVE